MFTPKHVIDEKTFDSFLASFLPGAAAQQQAIKQHYDCKTAFKGDWNKCVGTIIRDASFTCNTRNLYDAFPDKTYMMRYAFPVKDAAHHGSDMVPLFTTNATEAKHMLVKNGMDEDQAETYSNYLFFNYIPRAYRRYFASFAVSGGNPNLLRQANRAPEWPLADGSEGNHMTNVMSVELVNLFESAFKTRITDKQNAKDTCEFWTKMAGEIVGTKGADVPWDVSVEL